MTLIVLSGCSGGGKSTLLNMMAGRGYNVFPEPGRQIVQEQIKNGKDGVPWKNLQQFCELCVARYIEYHQSAKTKKDTVILDRSLIDAISAIEHFQFETSLGTSQLIEVCTYSPTVYLTPPWKEIYVNDDERKHSFDEALEEYARLTISYKKYGYKTVELPKYSVTRRTDYFESCILSDIDG